MQPLKEREAGILLWDGRDHLHEIKSLGVRCGQLGIDGSIDLDGNEARDWKAALDEEQFTIATVVAAYNGESYADFETVKRTVGFVPEAGRAERERRTVAVSDFAAALGVKNIACHVGFVPEHRQHRDYGAVREIVRRICDHAARNGQTFALETGQEPAPVLAAFIEDAGRENLGINFDPANMILYGTGDPIEALDVLAPYVLSVHCKDGDWPPAGSHGQLGKERPLGQGAVGIPRFLNKLKEIGYTGPLTIERETDDQAQRLIDLRMAVELLRSYGAN